MDRGQNQTIVGNRTRTVRFQKERESRRDRLGSRRKTMKKTDKKKGKNPDTLSSWTDLRKVLRFGRNMATMPTPMKTVSIVRGKIRLCNGKGKWKIDQPLLTGAESSREMGPLRLG